MRRTTCLPIIALAAVVVTSGCEKTPTRKAIVLNPTTRQSATIEPVEPPPPPTKVVTTGDPATPASTTQTTKMSHIMVDQAWFDFPAAKLIVRKEGEKVRALLCSNDPPEVISPAYVGNRYSFEMLLDRIDNVQDVATADFIYKAPSQEPQETPNGIFLDGDRQHLQPYDIRVVFEKKGDHLVAEIQGTFVRVTKGNRLGDLVYVMAYLSAKPEYK